MKKLPLAPPIAATAAVIVGVAALTAGSAAGAAPSTAVAAAEPMAAASAVPTPREVAQPRTVWDPIRYSAKRKRQMAAYSWRHYRQRTWDLVAPKQVVLHYTVTSNYPSVHNWFNSNSPSPGNAGTRKELPGACTHFVIDRDGTIYQLAPLELMCRHVVGLNNQTIGIEFVEMRSAANILRRPAQLQAGLDLVRWLQSRFGIATGDVIGHGMANKSRFFVDYRGWVNDHTDWNGAQVRAFRSQL